MKKLSFPKEKIRVFLLEKIHASAEETFRAAGYTDVTMLPQALSGKDLREIIAEAHILGVRSRTKVSSELMVEARRLLAIGCFSVGTDQVDLAAARGHGIPVFNAPYSSTRSVAELTLGNILSLARRVADRSAKLHMGAWRKSASGSFEVRGKVLGIVGYGHIGQQVGLLAEAVGMDVIYYDVVRKLPLGRANPVTFETLLQTADFVTLHVPGGPVTKNFIGEKELSMMKKGSYLLNLSRGTVVDLLALQESLKSEHLAGAALDVYPEEPVSNTDDFESELRPLENVVMTPHIGGSTQEAQENIGREVAESLIDFLDIGTTAGSVNFPSVHLRPFPQSHRILNVHRNIPGALKQVNEVISDTGANIDAQYLSTFEDIGYLIVDINKEVSDDAKNRIAILPASIRTRILY